MTLSETERERIREDHARYLARIEQAKEIAAMTDAELDTIRPEIRGTPERATVTITGLDEDQITLDYSTVSSCAAIRRLLPYIQTGAPRIESETVLWPNPHMRVNDQHRTYDGKLDERVTVYATIRGGRTGNEIHISEFGSHTFCGHDLIYDTRYFEIAKPVTCKKCAEHARTLGFPIDEAAIALPNPKKSARPTCKVCKNEIAPGEMLTLGKRTHYCKACYRAELAAKRAKEN